MLKTLRSYITLAVKKNGRPSGRPTQNRKGQAYRGISPRHQKEAQTQLAQGPQAAITRLDMKGVFYKGGNALWTDDEDGEKILRNLGDGELVEIDIKRPRNLTNLRRYWKLCSFIAEGTGRLTREEVSGVLKLSTGHADVVEVNGVTYKIPKSIAFDNMEDAEFDAFYNRACRQVCIDFVPHMTADLVREEVERMVGIRYERR